MGRRACLLLGAVLAACAGPPAAAVTPALPAVATAALHPIAEFSISRSRANAVPYAVAAGPDGAIWFTEPGANAIGRIAPDGAIRTFALAARNAQPQGIALGSDGALYFAENEGPSPYGSHLARITTAGTVTQWNDNNYMPQGVAAGPDGSIWFTQGCAGVARISRSGRVAQFGLDGISSQTGAIVQGPDRAMWFVESGTLAIGRITAAGALTLFKGPLYQNKYADFPNGVAVGPDGNLWWTSDYANIIWAMNTHGRVVHRYEIPTPRALPWGIVAGPDGALWFTERDGNKIGRVTVAGRFAEYPLPTAHALPLGIAVGADGNLWFAESGANKIGRIAP